MKFAWKFCHVTFIVRRTLLLRKPKKPQCNNIQPNEMFIEGTRNYVFLKPFRIDAMYSEYKINRRIHYITQWTTQHCACMCACVRQRKYTIILPSTHRTLFTLHWLSVQISVWTNVVHVHHRVSSNGCAMLSTCIEFVIKRIKTNKQENDSKLYSYARMMSFKILDAARPVWVALAWHIL